MATAKPPPHPPAKPAAPAPQASANEICTLRIDLLETDPRIWREVEIPTAITLKGLHDIVQIAMGWFDCHLWQFDLGGQLYAPPADREHLAPAADPSKTRLRDILTASPTRIDYLYDMGDCWSHRLTLGNIREGDPETPYPRLVAGERACPPENSGGIAGFYQMLDAKADPAHPEHAEAVAWLDDYDPADLEEPAIKIGLGRIANRRTAARKRLSG